jgi:hypothetical protein
MLIVTHKPPASPYNTSLIEEELMERYRYMKEEPTDSASKRMCFALKL